MVYIMEASSKYNFVFLKKKHMIEIGCNNIHSEITKLKKLNGILLKDSDLCNLKK